MTPMTPSSSPSLPMPPCEVIALDRHRLVVEHEAQRVGVVDGDVEHDAAARLGLLDPPALQMGRQIDGMEHAREQRLADPPRLIASRIARCVAALRR